MVCCAVQCSTRGTGYGECARTEAVVEREGRAEHVVRGVEAHAPSSEVRVVHDVVVRERRPLPDTKFCWRFPWKVISICIKTMHFKQL